MKIHIYQIYFPTSGKSYIGQTCDLQRRMNEHLSAGSLVCRALYKYDDWVPSVLHTCKSRDEASRIEIEEIRNFNSVAPGGYNLTHGGEGGDTFSGKHHTEETKEKLRIAHKGNQYRKGKTGYKRTKKEIQKGIDTKRENGTDKHTEETKEKMRQAKLGTHWEVCEEGRKNMANARRGNQNAKGHKCSDETKAKMRKAKEGKRNPMQDPEVVLRNRISKLGNKIEKLEQELNDVL